LAREKNGQGGEMERNSEREKAEKEKGRKKGKLRKLRGGRGGKRGGPQRLQGGVAPPW